MDNTILRINDAARRGGISRAVVYERQQAGLWPATIKVGPRQSGFFAHEIDELNAARAAGFSDEKVRELVRAMHARRKRAGREVEARLREAAPA